MCLAARILDATKAKGLVNQRAYGFNAVRLLSGRSQVQLLPGAPYFDGHCPKSFGLSKINH
jgi:hypothetical protein